MVVVRQRSRLCNPDALLCYSDGKTRPQRGDKIVTVKYWGNSLCKSKEDYQVWIVTSIIDDMLKGKCDGAESWRQAFFCKNMELVETTS